MKKADWSALGLLAFEIPSFFLSQYRANSARTTEAIILAVLIYFVVRLLVSTPTRKIGLVGLLSVGGCWLTLSGIRGFISGTGRLAQVGLTDFVAFRSRLVNPIGGWLPGEAFTVLLLTLSPACAVAAYVWRRDKNAIALIAFVVALITAGLTLSLSRAVFWSTVLFFVSTYGLMATYRVVTLWTASLWLTGTLAGLLVVLVCESIVYPGLFKAYSGSHASQNRSTQGRLNIWTRSFELMRGHRLWGVGSANAALFLTSSASQEDTTGFASRTFSLPVQVLMEKGIVGFGLYSAFLVLVGYEFHRTMRCESQDTHLPLQTHRKGRASSKRKQEALQLLQAEAAHKAMKCCFAADMLAVLFRELTYSSLLEHALTLVLFSALAALASGEVSDAL
jgi:hypothetical protein